MRIWERARGFATLCGNCSRVIREGEPIQLIRLDAPIPQKKRCTSCASGPIDEEQLERFDIAEEGRRQIKSTPQPMTRLKNIKGPLFDPKMAAAGDRE